MFQAKMLQVDFVKKFTVLVSLGATEQREQVGIFPEEF